MIGKRIKFKILDGEKRPEYLRESAKQDLGAVIFLFIVTIILAWQGYYEPYREYHNDYVVTPCKVINSQALVYTMRGRYGGEHHYYVPIIEFSYTWQGTNYVSNYYRLVRNSSRFKSWAQNVVNQYPAGKETACFVNKHKPTEAMIEWQVSYWSIFMGILCPIMGLMALVVLYKTIQKFRLAAVGGLPETVIEFDAVSNPEAENTESEKKA